MRRLIVVCLAVVAVAGCGSDSSAAKHGYVGTLQGPDAFVAIVAADDEAVVYVCNGDEGIGEWFEGRIDDSADFILTNVAGASVQAMYVDETWQGDVTFADGSTHAFTTVVAEDGAGIHNVDDDDAAAEGVWAAWIIDNEGNERGAVSSRGSLVTATSKFAGSSFRFGGFTFTVSYQGTDGADVSTR